jgi:hypothetical protein
MEEKLGAYWLNRTNTESQESHKKSVLNFIQFMNDDKEMSIL